MDNSKYAFVLIGDIENNKNKSELNSIYITGFTNNIYQYLKFVNHVVIPSKSEAFSRAILEPLVINIPASCFNVGGNIDVVGDNYPFIIDYNIEHSMKINFFKQHIIESNNIKQNIDFIKYKEKFNIEKITEKILKILDEENI